MQRQGSVRSVEVLRLSATSSFCKFCLQVMSTRSETTQTKKVNGHAHAHVRLPPLAPPPRTHPPTRADNGCRDARFVLMAPTSPELNPSTVPAHQGSSLSPSTPWFFNDFVFFVVFVFKWRRRNTGTFCTVLHPGPETLNPWSFSCASNEEDYLNYSIAPTYDGHETFLRRLVVVCAIRINT